MARNSRLLIIWASDGERQHRWCKNTGKIHGGTLLVHQRLVKDSTTFWLWHVSKAVMPHFHKSWTSPPIKPRSRVAPRAAFWPGTGPQHLQTQKPQPWWKRPSFSEAVSLAHTSLVKGKWNVTYVRGLSRGLRWTRSKKGRGSRWGRGFTELWATRRSRQRGERAGRAHHFADNQEETACTYEYITHIYAQSRCVHIKYACTHTTHNQTK